LTLELSGGNYTYENVYVGGTLKLLGDVNLVVTNSFVLDGLIDGAGSDGDDGRDARTTCSLICGVPVDASRGDDGQGGFDLSIQSASYLLAGTIDLSGGDGGRGGSGKFEPPLLLKPDGAPGGNGGEAGRLTLFGELFRVYEDFLVDLAGGDGGRGGDSVNPVIPQPGGPGGNGGNGGHAVFNEADYLNLAPGEFEHQILIDGGAGGARGLSNGSPGGGSGGSTGTAGSFSVVPEPASLALLIAGGVVPLGRRRPGRSGSC
jgi:hypothetical protein